MFRNVLASALHNLVRNRLYAAISIAGLAVAMAAAMLTGLYIRDELTFDRFIPGSDKVYVVTSDIRPPGRARLISDLSPPALAGWLKTDFPEIQKITRIVESTSNVRRGEIESSERIAWVDPAFFDVLPLPTLTGDPKASMARPEGVVITRKAARKYFGQDNPVGQMLELSRAMPMRVGAVLKDIPANSTLRYDIFAAGVHPTSAMRRGDSVAVPRGALPTADRTFVRLADPALAVALGAQMQAFKIRRMTFPDGKFNGGVEADFPLVPFNALHMLPISEGMTDLTGGQGNPTILIGLALVAALILLMAGTNFVNLMTARASQRMVEVGVRKLAGAERKHLILQFVGEALIYALLGLLLALAMAELLLPAARAALDRPLSFEYWRDPPLVGATVLMALVLGLAAGAYPAFVQSGFRPAAVLKGGVPAGLRGLAVREGLVVSQFGVLIGLLLAAAVITVQTHFVMSDGLRVAKDHVVMLDVTEPPDLTKPRLAVRRVLCREAFLDRVRALPGVVGAACSSITAMGVGEGAGVTTGPNGLPVTLSPSVVDYGFFDLYGLKPAAGRFFNQPGDALPNVRPFPKPRVLILNARAAKALGFSTPAKAVGQVVALQWGGEKIPAQVVGVAPDFEFNSLRRGGVRPILYFLQPGNLDLMHIKLSGPAVPEALKGISGLWRETGFARGVRYRFVDDYLREIYLGVLRQGVLIDVLCGIAVVIGCLGLFGLAAFTAERRTKEIGVRKVMGASKTDVVKLLLWSFTRPVLWANVVAWPVGWWAMNRWLHGFSTRIALSPLFFIGAGAAALLIAALTVSAHALRIAQAKPVGALRYE